jgi:hypothetical protein
VLSFNGAETFSETGDAHGAGITGGAGEGPGGAGEESGGVTGGACGGFGGAPDGACGASAGPPSGVCGGFGRGLTTGVLPPVSSG